MYMRTSSVCSYLKPAGNKLDTWYIYASIHLPKNTMRYGWVNSILVCLLQIPSVFSDKIIWMKNSVFWDITPCSPLKVNRRFGGSRRLRHQGRRIIQARNHEDGGIKHECLLLASMMIAGTLKIETPVNNKLHGMLKETVLLSLETRAQLLPVEFFTQHSRCLDWESNQ
jgi:hypothetical protein